jgi:hypothetical protein
LARKSSGMFTASGCHYCGGPFVYGSRPANPIQPEFCALLSRPAH